MIIKWAVSNWNDHPERREYSRETEHFYMRANSRGRDSKISRYECFFDGEAEALGHIAKRNAARIRSKEIDQIKRHAVELLEALESCVGWLEWLDDPRCGLGDDHKKFIKQGRAAITKAKGKFE